MKITSIINLKGGVGKTMTAAGMAHILAKHFNKRVLLIDNDKQGNATKLFAEHSYRRKSVADILTDPKTDPREVIRATRFDGLSIIPANMKLAKANLEILLDKDNPQQTHFRDALAVLHDEYDYCIIDNAPDLNISIINALAASDDVIIPVKIDAFAFDGLKELTEQIDATRSGLNPRIKLLGCLITCYQRTDAEQQGAEYLRMRTDYPVFDTQIRWSKKVGESTFAKAPIAEYSRRSAAAIDYIAFVHEYLEKTK